MRPPHDRRSVRATDVSRSLQQGWAVSLQATPEGVREEAAATAAEHCKTRFRHHPRCCHRYHSLRCCTSPAALYTAALWNDDNGVSQTEPLHIRQESPTKKKAINNNNLSKRFYFVAFGTPGKAAHKSIIDQVAAWPLWSLADGGADVQVLFEGLTDDAKADMWVASKRNWFAVRRDMEHRVTTDCTLIFHRRGEVWDNTELETIINSNFLPPPPPHYRYNLPVQRKALAAAYKQSPSTPAVPLLQLPNVAAPDVLGQPTRVNLLKRALDPAADDDDDVRPTSRPRLTIDTHAADVSSGSTTSPPWSAVTPASASPSPSMSTATLPPNPLHPLAVITAPVNVLPSGFAGMHVVDVVSGFHKMEQLHSDKSLDLEARFKCAFPARKFNGNTYRDNALSTLVLYWIAL
uniref:Uncharacterized protein n=1 Tax=Mycena chlorophos TaxID=658473 RepID=A0ABQ0LYD7_MYCCL|nr:predicted protein [Mycena chlorophos]